VEIDPDPHVSRLPGTPGPVLELAQSGDDASFLGQLLRGDVKEEGEVGDEVERDV
jgi:hypothetical protein